MAQYGWTENYGQVGRLYPTSGKVYFKLMEGKTAMNPKDGYYYVPTSHDNYKAMIDLLYTAADRRWKIHARTKENLVGGYAEVIYFVVDW